MSWERPKTVKMYLHPPKAGRLITLWPDFKVVSAQPDERPESYLFESRGFRFLFGEDAQAPNWQASSFVVRDDGIPVHALAAEHGGFRFEVEAFCSWDDVPDTYVRLTVVRPAGAAGKVTFGIMPRAGKDAYLYGITGDMYASYRPLLEHWDMAPATFSFENGCLNDGTCRIGFFLAKGAKARRVERNPRNPFAKEYLELECASAGPAVFYFRMTERKEAAVNEATYQAARAQAVSRWQAELAKVRTTPNVPAGTLVSMVYSLVCQCLQMFATGDGGRVWPRQGGSRWAGVWPGEAIEFLMALDRMGLTDWAEKGYRFFQQYQITEGNDKGRFVGRLAPIWENTTGGVFYGLAHHLRTRNDARYFAQWRQSILDGLAWIESRRAETKDASFGLGRGLFPPAQPHDWELKVQAWCWTDALLYMGVRAMAETFAHFDDPSARRFLAVAEDYKACLKRVLDAVCAPQADRDEVFVPNYLGMPETYPPPGPYFVDGPAFLIRAGIIEPNSEVFQKVERYFVNRGWMQNGLTGLMTDSLLACRIQSDPWAGHTWYTSFSDMCWFSGWLARGEREKAARTLEAQMRYGMSPEFYMQERYADNDPTFCPWQPNASANGRLIEMLFRFYGESDLPRP